MGDVRFGRTPLCKLRLHGQCGGFAFRRGRWTLNCTCKCHEEPSEWPVHEVLSPEEARRTFFHYRLGFDDDGNPVASMTRETVDE